MKRIFPLIAGLLIAGLPVFSQDGAAEKPAFGVGSEVEDYPQVKWIQGEPVTRFDKDKIYIVECWATWCPPCVESIPHLNELSRKFDGKIIIIGQGVWEEEEQTVRDFVKEQGEDMRYRVAFSGGRDSDFTRSWLKPAGVKGIPQAFVIQDNKIVWMPHPVEMTEDILQMLVNGTFTLAAAEAASPIKKMNEAEALMQDNKMAEAMEKLDQVLAKDPGSAQANYMKAAVLEKQGKQEELLEFAKQLYEKYPQRGRDIYYEQLLRQKHYNILLDLTEKDLARKPEDVRVIITRYNAYMAMGNQQAAVDMINRAAVTNNIQVLSVLTTLEAYNPDIPAEPALKAAMLKAGYKGLSISPTNFQLMLTVARKEWETNKTAAKAVVSKSAAAIRNDPKQKQYVAVTNKLEESLAKDVMPDNEQLNKWFQESMKDAKK